MRKFFLFAIAFIFSIFICSPLMAQSRTYEEQTQKSAAPVAQRNLYCGSFDNPIRIVGHMNYPPFGWKEMEISDKINARAFPIYYGIGIDLFDKFAKEYDLRYSYVNMLNLDEARYALTRGYFDVLVTDYFLPNSYAVINHFYPGYITNPIVIVTLKPQKDEKLPETLDDLVGKKGIVRAEENIFDMVYSKLPEGVNLKKVNGIKYAFQALLRKDVDFLIMSQYAYETEVRRYKIGEYLTYSKAPILYPVVFMSYAAGNQCAAFIKAELEKKLKEYSADENLIRSLLSKQIVAWENKFRDEKSLMYEKGVVAEEIVERAQNLDEWLKEQQKNSDKEDSGSEAQTEKEQSAPSTP